MNYRQRMRNNLYKVEGDIFRLSRKFVIETGGKLIINLRKVPHLSHLNLIN